MAVKRTQQSCRGLRVNSQHPHAASQPSVNAVKGCNRHYIHAGKTVSKIHKSKKNTKRGKKKKKKQYCSCGMNYQCVNLSNAIYYNLGALSVQGPVAFKSLMCMCKRTRTHTHYLPNSISFPISSTGIGRSSTENSAKALNSSRDFNSCRRYCEHQGD